MAACTLRTTNQRFASFLIALVRTARVGPDTSEVAAQALIDFGPSAIPAILTTLQNEEEDEIVSLLLRVVNVIGGREAIPSILQFLDHDNPMIRRLALETLGEIPDPASIDRNRRC